MSLRAIETMGYGEVWGGQRAMGRSLFDIREFYICFSRKHKDIIIEKQITISIIFFFLVNKKIALLISVRETLGSLNTGK